jgi:hypothetical protein
MSGAIQATFMNQRSFVPPFPTVAGEAYGGGFFAGQIGVSGVATHYLIVAPRSSGQTTTQWKTSDTSTSGTSSVIDGVTNSSNMNNASHPAAQFCEGLSIGGFTDWYLPAKNEIEVCYYNLKPSTGANNTSIGINANSVPERTSNYTSGTPAQTSAAIFQDGGGEEFQTSLGRYWSSTEYSSTIAWCKGFGNGFDDKYRSKTSNYGARAVRRIAV